jgi:hypothetical protein
LWGLSVSVQSFQSSWYSKKKYDQINYPVDSVRANGGRR